MSVASFSIYSYYDYELGLVYVYCFSQYATFDCSMSYTQFACCMHLFDCPIRSCHYCFIHHDLSDYYLSHMFIAPPGMLMLRMIHNHDTVGHNLL